MTQMAIKGAVARRILTDRMHLASRRAAGLACAASRRAASDTDDDRQNGIVPAFCKKTNLRMALAINRARFS